MKRFGLFHPAPVAGLIVLVLVALIGASVQSLRHFQSTRQAARLSRDIRETAAACVAAGLDVETSQRGFLLTTRQQYLEPFESGAKHLHESLDALDALVADSAPQRERARALRVALDAKLEELRHTLDLASHGRRDEALAIVLTDAGKRSMDDARRIADEIRNDEATRLEARYASLRHGFVVGVSVDAGAAAATFFLGWLLFAINRDIRRRQDLEDELRVTVGRERATRRQAEALSSEVERRNIELFVSREQFFTTLRSIGDAVISTDRGGKVTFLNGVAEALTGWSNAEAAGKPLEEVFVIINESSRQSVENPVERVIREGIVVGLANHTILVNRDGSEAAIADSAAPIRRDDGELVGVVLVFRDVSAERDDERRQRFVARGAVELSSSLDYETTLSTVAQLAVPEFADWCAVDLLEPGGLRRLAVAHIDPAKVSLVGEIARRYPADPNAKNGSPNILRTGEAEMIADIPVALLDAAARDEEHLTLIRQLSLRSYIGAPLKSRGSIIGVISFAMAESNRLYRESDLRAAQAIAERAATAIDNARLYREAQRLRGDAELANRAKDEFLAMLGHELRNPLAPIVSALHLVRARVGQQIERELTILERQVRHVVRLVDDLLDVSRIARGRIQLQREPVDLPDVVAKAAELARPLLDEKEHRLTVQVPAGLAVSGDPVRLTQVMSNLLNNAAKYTDAGGLIEVSAAREGDKIVLRVRDNGIGISPEVLPRVFDMFVQEPQSIDRTKGGLGLGLAIVRTLVTAHDGTVGAHSDGTGRGTELRVELPALPEGTLVPARGHAATLEAHAIGRPATRLLVVDDNADAAELLSDSLTLLGYEAHRAHDAEAALKLAAQVRPEVAVLDLGLPVIDGYELARRLRELEGLSGLRLIAVTGYGQSSDRDRSKAAGFDAHLVKPITVDEIHRVLEAL